MRLTLSDIWLRWKEIPFWQRRLLIGVVLLFDAYLGMSYGVGLVVWSGFRTGDFKWMLLVLEMAAGGLVLVHALLNVAKHRWKTAVTISTPVLIAVLGFVILEVALSGLGRSATLNFNLASMTLSGLYWAAAYLSVAIGLTLTYKVQRFGNFAQAEMMLIGGYVALTVMWSDRFFPIADAPKDDILNWKLLIWAAIFAFAVTGLIGLVADRVIYKRLRKKLAAPQVMMIASLGVAMILRAALYMRYSARTFRFVPDRDWKLATSKFDIPTERLQFHLGERIETPIMEFAENVNPYGFAYTKSALIIGVFGAVFLLLILLHRTRLGRKMRAVADNPDLAATSGIHVERVHGTSAFLSAGMSGLGGALLAAILPINPELGISLLLPAFAVIVLGTIGSIPGVIIGALIVGMVRAISDPLLIGAGNSLDRPTASGFAEVMPFVFLVGVLLLTPRGIGSAIQQWSIERTRRGRTAVSNESRSLLNTVLGYMGQASKTLGSWSDQMFELIDQAFASLGTGISLVFAIPTKYLSKLKSTSKSTLPSTSGFSRYTARLRVSPSKLLPIDRETERGSWIAFGLLLVVLIAIVWMLPSVSTLTKTMQVARVIALVSIFGLMTFSLNLHTGITGMTNFGVIFFVGIGAITVGLLAAPVETNGYGWSPWQATILAVVVSGAVGWLLVYPTSKLRMDYFAIVTISLGEMLRISLQAEPMLRAGTVTSAIGISRYARPLEGWWESGPAGTAGNILGLDGDAPYLVFLALLSVVFLLSVWYFLNTVLSSPWGRILRSIREDEEVSQHHGHNILTHKAMSLALGAAVAALAGALWAWLNTSIFPDFMNPVRSTFLVWAAFIVGGKGNNRGMIIGAFLIVIVEFVFNVMVVSRGDASLAFHGLVSYLDRGLEWLLTDVGRFIWSDLSVTQAFQRGEITVQLSYLKLALIGIVIVGALLLSAKGLLPEVPSRPRRPEAAPDPEELTGTARATEEEVKVAAQ